MPVEDNEELKLAEALESATVFLVPKTLGSGSTSVAAPETLVAKDATPEGLWAAWEYSGEAAPCKYAAPETLTLLMSESTCSWA
jgi:hypothetical protein